MSKNYSMVVQYNIVGLGTDEDLDRRYRVQELLNDALQASNNGSCTDGDMGNDKMNIFVDNITDLSGAFDAITETLLKSGDLEDAVIAVDVYDEENDPDGPAYEVVWPTSYSGAFDVF